MSTQRWTEDQIARQVLKVANQNARAAMGVTPNKFRNQKTTVDNIVFHSKKEAARYHELKLLQKAGAIQGLELQPRFELCINGVTLGEYVADFAYEENDTGERIVEDVKSEPTQTPLWRWKVKHLSVQYGITVKTT